jgi:hypothetical protein
MSKSSRLPYVFGTFRLDRVEKVWRPRRGSRLYPNGSEGVGPGSEEVSSSGLMVLPFVNLGSPDDRYFVAGTTEEINSRLTRLSRLGGRKVRRF